MLLRRVKTGARLCHIVIHTIFTQARIVLLVILSMLAVLAMVDPSLLLEIAVRGGLLAGGVGLAIASKPHGDAISG